MIVVKFGGTSVADAEAILRTMDIVRGRAARQPVVVVSALGGVTNELLAVADQAPSGQLNSAQRIVEGLRERHLKVAEALLASTPALAAANVKLGATFDELASLAEALSVLGHVTPRSLDAIASMGERLSAMLVVAAFVRHGLPADEVDPRKVLITDEAFTKAEPRPTQIAQAARAVLAPLLRAGRIPVLGGFVGASERGVTTTLGRGGSDYSASLIGAALQAEAIEIWTDVDGMLTSDPRLVKGGKLLERIRFDEASELAYFGAKVLHPSTIAPAVQLGIPVYILNSRKPEGKGTLITFEAPRRAVSAIAGKAGLAVIKVGSPRMLLAHGFLRSVFDIFAKHRVSVDVVATSEISISVTVDEASGLEDLLLDLAQLGDVAIDRNRAIIAVVGTGMSDDSTAMARALTALQGAKVHMVSVSATGINLTMIVDGDNLSTAMQRLHDEFFATAPAPAAVTAGV